MRRERYDFDELDDPRRPENRPGGKAYRGGGSNRPLARLKLPRFSTVIVGFCLSIIVTIAAAILSTRPEDVHRPVPVSPSANEGIVGKKEIVEQRKHYSPTGREVGRLPSEMVAGQVARELIDERGDTCSFAVIQVQSDRSALLSHDGIVYFVETDTRGWFDGKKVRILGYVECLGTMQYTTVLKASKTVLHLRELN